MKRMICGDEVQEVLEIWVRKTWMSEEAVRRSSSKYVCLEISQNLQENT